MTTTRPPGIYDIPAAEYHRDTWALSASMLKEFASDRVKFHQKYVTGLGVSDTSDAMDLGTVIHTMLLEPDRLATSCVEIPEAYATQTGLSKKADAQKWKESIGDAVALTKADFLRASQAVASAESILVNAFGVKWRDLFIVEQSIYWVLNGKDCRSRDDLISKDIVSQAGDRRLIIDLKSCRDSSETAFARDYANRMYWVQDSHYSSGAKSHFGEDFAFWVLAVETDGTFNAAFFEPEESYRHAARIKYGELIRDMDKCCETGDWRNVRSRMINPIRLKPWTFGENYDG